MFAYPFLDENRKKDAYWRDVGTLDAYYEANMDLISVDPLLNMYDQHWPIRTYQPNLPPPKFVFAETGSAARRGQALDSIVCAGLDRLRRAGRAFDRRRQHPHQQLRPGRGFDSLRRGERRAGTRRFAGRSSTRRWTFRPGSRSASTATSTVRRGFTISDGGMTVIAKTHAMDHIAAHEP